MIQDEPYMANESESQKQKIRELEDQVRKLELAATMIIAIIFGAFATVVLQVVWRNWNGG